MKTYEEGLSPVEKILFIVTFCFGFSTSIRGGYWTFNLNATNDSELYESLNNLLSLHFWGVLFLLSGILLMMSAFFIFKHEVSNTFYTLLMFGGLIGSVPYAFLGMAGMENAINLITPGQNIVHFGMLFLCGFIGGSTLWKRSRS
ncbi:tail protein [Staphylococcus phage PG-2021_4]